MAEFYDPNEVYDPNAPLTPGAQPQSLPAGVQPMTPAPSAFREAAANLPPEADWSAGFGPQRAPGYSAPSPAPYDKLTVPEGPAPGTLASLAAGQQPQQGNPYLEQMARMSPQDLARTVSMGGSSSSATSTTSGVPMLPGAVQADERATAQQQRAMRASAEAQAHAQTETAFARNLTQAQLEFRQVQTDKARSTQTAQIESLDAEAAKIRADVAKTKIDPDRWWKTRHPAQVIALALAAGMKGFMQGFRREGGPNPVLQMIEGSVDRDVAAQRADLETKKGSLADTRGAMADVYRRIGDMDQAEAQTRILLTEGLKTRMETIGATAQSEVIRQGMEQGIAAADQSLWSRKNAAYQASLPRKQTSTTSSSQRVPLFEVLQAQAKGYQAQNPSKPLEMPPDKVLEQLQAVQAARHQIDKVYSMTRRLSMGEVRATESFKTDTQRLAMQAKLAMMKVRGGVESNAMAQWDAKIWEGAIMNKWDDAEDVRKRLGDAHGLLTSVTDAIYGTYGKKYDVGKWVGDELRSRQRTQVMYGTQGH